jgi:3-hydroxybutyryl-CoA dehydratase
VKVLADFRAGDTFELTRQADRYRPVYYAAVSGDFNPIHIDPEVGRAAGFPGAILQGPGSPTPAPPTWATRPA